MVVHFAAIVKPEHIGVGVEADAAGVNIAAVNALILLMLGSRRLAHQQPVVLTHVIGVLISRPAPRCVHHIPHSVYAHFIPRVRAAGNSTAYLYALYAFYGAHYNKRLGKPVAYGNAVVEHTFGIEAVVIVYVVVKVLAAVARAAVLRHGVIVYNLGGQIVVDGVNYLVVGHIRVGYPCHNGARFVIYALGAAALFGYGAQALLHGKVELHTCGNFRRIGDVIYFKSTRIVA